MPVATDLSCEADLERLAQVAVDRFGGADILINNGAVTQLDSWAAPLLEFPGRLVLPVCCQLAPFILTQLLVPGMEARGQAAFST